VRDQQRALASHRLIADLIRRGDSDGAMTASRKHLVASMGYVCSPGKHPPAADNGRVVDASPLRA
jgi:DNA-binding FadR family transcriptional regulator